MNPTGASSLGASGSSALRLLMALGNGGGFDIVCGGGEEIGIKLICKCIALQEFPKLR